MWRNGVSTRLHGVRAGAERNAITAAYRRTNSGRRNDGLVTVSAWFGVLYLRTVCIIGGHPALPP